MENQESEGRDVLFGESVLVDTKEETDKKCPCCGGIMDFDPAVGNLHCPYCDHIEEILKEGEVDASAEEKEFLKAEKIGNCNWGVETKMVLCKACGGEMVYDALQIAGECPYCGSNQVMEAKGEDTLAPDGVCVFKIDAGEAVKKFKSWIKKRWFCPKEAKESAKPKEIKGLYLPYWTFDTNTETQYSAEYGIYRHKKNSKGETITVTDWHSCKGTYHETIDDQPVCATTRHGQDILNGLQPFHTEDNKVYRPEYIAGFVSERYSIGLKDAWETAKSLIKGRLERNIKRKIEKDYHANTVRSLRVKTSYTKIKYKYLLLPVWMAHFKYKDKIYQFMVNGQTGKVSGKIPISPAKVAISVVGVLLLLALMWWISNL